ncbi:MAG: hypothetical protein QXI95_00110 [Candidatus Micrarchaeaceae archaeon]
MCRRNVEGLPVRIDTVIKVVRWFAVRLSKNTQLHTLVVCKDCYLPYIKARKKYLRKRNTYFVLGILFTGMLCSMSLNSPIKFLLALLAGLIITGGMYLLALLNYVPALENEKTEKKKRIFEK